MVLAAPSRDTLSEQNTITLVSSQGEERTFVVGLEWIEARKRSSIFEAYKTSRDINASAFVPLDYLNAFYVGNNRKDVLGLPALGAALLDVFCADPDNGDTEENIVFALRDHVDHDRYVFLQIADNVILRGWDTVCNLNDLLHIIHGKQNDVERILIASDMEQAFEPSLQAKNGLDATKVEFFNIDLLFEAESNNTPLKPLPLKNILATTLGTLAVILSVGVWTFDDYIKPFFVEPPKVVIKAPAKKYTYASASELLLACDEAWYNVFDGNKTAQGPKSSALGWPLGWKATEITCRGQPQPRSPANAAGLRKSQIIVSWSILPNGKPSLLRPIAEAHFANWDYGVVLDRTAESRNALKVNDVVIPRESIPSFVNFRRALDRFIGITATKLNITKAGTQTVFTFETVLPLSKLATTVKNIPALSITSISRNLKLDEPNWRIEGQLAAIPEGPKGASFKK